MSITVTLTATDYAFIDANSPNSNSHGQQRQQIYYEDRTTMCLLHFERLAAQYKYRKLSNLHFHGKARVDGSFYITELFYSDSSFNPNSVTYNTRPSQSGGTRDISLGSNNPRWKASSPGTPEDVWNEVAIIGVLPCDVLRGETVWLTTWRGSSSESTCELFTPASSDKPYFTVVVGDEDVHLTPTAVSPKNSYVTPHEVQRFRWTVAASSYASLETPAQTAAVLYWRESGAETWNTYSVSGADPFIDLPAETLSAANSIEWKVGITDSSGHSAESAVLTIGTKNKTLTATPIQPIGGYRVDRTRPFLFTWYCTGSGYGSSTPTASELRWSSDNGSTWTNLATISGSALEYTVPANTFPAGTILWAVRSTNVDGVVGPWTSASITTADSTATASVLSPVGSVEDGSKPITFRWTISNPSGWQPSRVCLWYKNDGDADWTVLHDVNQAITSYATAAGFFSAGEKQWAVSAWNRDGVRGPTSTGSFIVVAAPATPVVTADNAPFTTFEWQGDGQQAWRLTVDGKEYGPYFGTERSFTLPDYLEDGEHTASVEIQGLYGLWSDPGSVTFIVENVPGDEIVLTGEFGLDAELVWFGPYGQNDYLIYRDGVRIGHTAGASFTDRFVLGAHEWRVVNRLPGGMYTASNVITGSPEAQETFVAAFSGGEWLRLRLSENSSAEQRFTYSRTHSLRHMRGAVYPVLELSPYEDGSGSYDAAFADAASLAAFESLRGRLVILKSRDGNVLIGALTSVDKRVKDFYNACTFTVQRCHWEDYVDDQDG